MKKSGGQRIRESGTNNEHTFKNSSLPLWQWGVFLQIKAAGFLRPSPFTPQARFLHRKGTLFNCFCTLYQTRYDYFEKTAVDTLGFLFYKVAHCLYFTLGGENLAVFGHTLSGFYLLLHLITFCIQAIYSDKNCPSYNNNSTKLLN